MDKLDAQKAAMPASMAELEVLSGIQLTRDSILFFLLKFRDMDISDKDCRKRLIQTFVNSVFVYDDKIRITFNYSSDSRTVTLAQIEASIDADGFVCCAPCPTITHRYEPEILIIGTAFVLTIKQPVSM